MDLNDIVAQLDAEIARLTQAKEALLGISTKKSPGRPRGTAVAIPSTKKSKRKMSTAGKARIAAAQKLRWAKVNKAKKATAAK